MVFFLPGDESDGGGYFGAPSSTPYAHLSIELPSNATVVLGADALLMRGRCCQRFGEVQLRVGTDTVGSAGGTAAIAENVVCHSSVGLPEPDGHSARMECAPRLLRGNILSLQVCH